MRILKSRVYNVIRDDDENDLISNIFDGIIISLIFINVVLVVADTFDLPRMYSVVSGYIETVSVMIFSVEYLLRLWTSDLKFGELGPVKSRIKYVFSIMALIDLIAILPFYIPFLIPVDLRVLRAFRIVRLLRLFKMNRYTAALSSIVGVLKSKASQLLSSVFVVALLMVISSVLMYNVEHPAQPDVFKNAFSGLWWATATFTTVGYGDISPITAVGKVLSGIISVLGIGLVAVPTGIISAGFIEKLDHDKQCAEQKNYCPYCGKDVNQ